MSKLQDGDLPVDVSGSSPLVNLADTKLYPRVV